MWRRLRTFTTRTQSPDLVAQTASPATGDDWGHGLAVDLALISFFEPQLFYNLMILRPRKAHLGYSSWLYLSPSSMKVSITLGYCRSPVPGGNSAQDKSPAIQRSSQIPPQTLLFSRNLSLLGWGRMNLKISVYFLFYDLSSSGSCPWINLSKTRSPGIFYFFIFYIYFRTALSTIYRQKSALT